MIKITKFLILCLALFTNSIKADNNGCISFSVSQGTGCQWMCNYCATNLGTNNYYFTDNVCTYETGVGCVGNPLAGKLYTCCSADNTEDKDDDEFILEDFCSF
jgi:hypothetical protein